MRILLILLAGMLLLSACDEDKDPPKAASTAPAATASPAAEKLISIHPCELPIPAGEMIPGKFEVRENTPDSPGIGTAQCSRSWDRDAAELGTGGAARVAINARLYQTIPDGQSDFERYYSGEAGKNHIANIIGSRGFLRVQIAIDEVKDSPALGADQLSIYRAQYTRGNAIETWVDYYVFVRVKNTFASMQVSAQNMAGAEAKSLAPDMQTLAKKQADRLRAFPATADPVVPTQVPTGTLILPLFPTTPTATPQP
jgi:hypothetical protein